MLGTASARRILIMFVADFVVVVVVAGVIICYCFCFAVVFAVLCCRLCSLDFCSYVARGRVATFLAPI